MPDYGIRLLGTIDLLRLQRAVHDLHLGQRIPLQEFIKPIPSDVASLRPAAQPFPPYLDHSMAKLAETPLVRSYSVIPIVPSEFQRQFLMLPSDLGMPILPAPRIDPLQGTA
jgi:hypothetical protein